MATAQPVPIETQLLDRLVKTGRYSATVARALLEMEFSARDQRRMRELSNKASEGELSSTESEEIDAYLRVGNLLSLLKSRARLSLTKPSRAGKKRPQPKPPAKSSKPNDHSVKSTASKARK